MTNLTLPSGFTPRDLKSWHLYYVPQADTNVYRVSDVVKSAGGTDAGGILTVAPHTGAGAARGVIVSIDPGLPATGGLQPSGQRLSIPALKTRDYYLWVDDDPAAHFAVVDDGLTPANLVPANVGSFVNFTPGAAAAANGGSTAVLTSSTFGGAAGTGCCKVLQLLPGSGYGAAATWIVQFAMHELAQGGAGGGGGGGTSTIAGATDYNTATLPAEIAAMNTIAATIPTQALQVHAVPISGGNWDASTNSPTITSGTAPTDGILCRTVTVAGTTTVDGNSSWKVNDTITWNGTTWYRTAALPAGPGLLQVSAGAVPSVLAGGSARGVALVATDGTPSVGSIGFDVAAPVFAVSNQPWGIPSSGAVIGANGGALTLGTAFIETYGPTGATPFDGIWLKFNAGEVDTGSAADFWWVVMTSTTAGTVYNNHLPPGSAGLNKPPTTPTLFTTNVGTGATTGSTAQTLGWLLSLAGGTLGANGSFELEMSMRSNVSAGSKQLQPKFGGANVGAAAQSTAASSVVDQTVRYFNKNNASRQGSTVKSSTATASLTLAPTGSAVNTAAATTIGLDLKLATATDWVVCQFAAVKIWPAA